MNDSQSKLTPGSPEWIRACNSYFVLAYTPMISDRRPEPGALVVHCGHPECVNFLTSEKPHMAFALGSHGFTHVRHWAVCDDCNAHGCVEPEFFDTYGTAEPPNYRLSVYCGNGKLGRVLEPKRIEGVGNGQRPTV